MKHFSGPCQDTSPCKGTQPLTKEIINSNFSSSHGSRGSHHPWKYGSVSEGSSSSRNRQGGLFVEDTQLPGSHRPQRNNQQGSIFSPK